MKSKIILLLLLPVSFQILAFSPKANDEEEVQSVIEKLFEGMKNKDQELLKSLFHESALMHTVANGPDGSQLGNNSVADFIDRISGTPSSTILDERITSFKIRIDGDMAAAWTPYRFYVNDVFSHCGVNSFQLIKIQGNWKITYVIDTRRKENCE